MGIEAGAKRIATRLCKCPLEQRGKGGVGLVLLILNEHIELLYCQYLTSDRKVRGVSYLKSERHVAETRECSFHSVFHRSQGASMTYPASSQVAQNEELRGCFAVYSTVIKPEASE